VEANTQYVDGSYGGSDSDGTADKPWTEIGDAIAAAEPDAIVAVAEGIYAGAISISGKPVRLWGRCPALVEIDVGVASTALRVGTATGAEVHSLAVRGLTAGISVWSSTDVLLDQLVVAGHRQDGVEIDDTASVVLRNCLIEDNTRNLLVFGEAVIEGSVVRASRADQPIPGGGMLVQGTATVTGSVVEDNQGAGVWVSGGTVTLEGSVVRGTQIASTGSSTCAEVLAVPYGESLPTVTITGSLLQAAEGPGLLLAGGTAEVERTVIRDGSGDQATGIAVQPDDDQGSVLTVRQSSVERAVGLGIGIANSEVTLEGVAVRSTAPTAQGANGRGVEVVSLVADGPNTSAVLNGCLIDDHREVGMLVMDAQASLVTTAISNIVPNAGGAYGRGLQVQGGADSLRPTTLELEESRIDHVNELGVAVFGGTGTLEHVEIGPVTTNDQGLFGDGLVVASFDAPATAKLHASYIHDSGRAGVAAFGAEILTSASRIGCHAFDLDGEPFLGEPYQFEDLGGMWCGCGETPTTCQVVSAGVVPPEPMP
jgi:hypothetical protein